MWVYPFSFYEFLELKNIKINFFTVEKYENFMYEKIELLLKEYYLYGWYRAVILSKKQEDKINKISEIIDMYLKKDISFFLNDCWVIHYFRNIF